MSKEIKKKELQKKNKKWEKESSSQRVIRWDRLDNTANLFPSIAEETMTSVYRISVTLTEEVDGEILQQALDLVLPKMDMFNVRLRSGVFWHYFEENGKPAPRVLEEEYFPCRFIRPNKNNSYLFRVTYFEKRINLEVFHVLTDGMGGINFLRELTYQYLRLVHPELREEGDCLNDHTSLNREDSFLKNYKKPKPSGFERKRAHMIHQEKLMSGELGIIHGEMSVTQLKQLSKSLNVSINELLAGTFAWALYLESLHANASDKPIRIAVPVNLRPYYESMTTKNFFVMVSAQFHPGVDQPASRSGMDASYCFEDVLHIIAESLRSQINKEHLEELFSYSVSNQQNFVLRLVPLPIKNFVMKMVYNQSALAHTTTMTNIGNIVMEESYRPYVDLFHAYIPTSKGQPMKGTLCSYGDRLVFSFSTIIKDTHIERRFFKTLAEQGIDVKISTNGVFYE